jgi:hypothetical protein
MSRPQPARATLLVAACGLALATATGTALAAPDEQAPPSRTTAPAGLCDDGSLCTWPERDYAGELTAIGDGAGGECYNLPRGAVSAINDSPFTAVFYTGEGCVGGVVVGVEPGRKTPSFAEAASVRLRRPGPAAAPGTQPGASSSPSGSQESAPAEETADSTTEEPADDTTASERGE